MKREVIVGRPPFRATEYFKATGSLKRLLEIMPMEESYLLASMISKRLKDSNLNSKSFQIKPHPNKDISLLSGAENKLISQML
jgi:hypothetical protein